MTGRPTPKTRLEREQARDINDLLWITALFLHRTGSIEALIPAPDLARMSKEWVFRFDVAPAREAFRLRLQRKRVIG